MPLMNLRVTVWGRAVKPVALALLFAMVVLVATNLADTGLLRFRVEGDVLAGGALATAALLTYGWWARSQVAAELGLAGACFVWTARFWIAVFTTPDWWRHEGIWLSLAWATIAAGSYLLERTDENVERRTP